MRLLMALVVVLTGCPKAAPVAAAVPERTGIVRRNDTPYTLLGTAVAVGDPAPGGALWDNDAKPVTLDLADGKPRVVAFVPSLDTKTCSLETRTFNGSASDLNPEVEVVVLSRDLPQAQARFCGAAGIDRVRTLSDFDTGAVGQSWGLLVKETRLFARAVAVVDQSGKITYLQVVENTPDEPDYHAALAALAAIAPPPPKTEEEVAPTEAAPE